MRVESRYGIGGLAPRLRELKDLSTCPRVKRLLLIAPVSFNASASVLPAIRPGSSDTSDAVRILQVLRLFDRRNSLRDTGSRIVSVEIIRAGGINILAGLIVNDDVLMFVAVRVRCSVYIRECCEIQSFTGATTLDSQKMIIRRSAFCLAKQPCLIGPRILDLWDEIDSCPNLICKLVDPNLT